MKRRLLPSRLVRVVAVVGVVVLTGFSASVGTATNASAVAHALIQGTGSSWSANAINQWDADVSSQGLSVQFDGSGSAQGRLDFANDTTDFGVTDIGYQGTDPVTGAIDTNCANGKCRDFAYEPVVAGGTSFPYQIKFGGKTVTNLRLSGLTLTKIFTRQIKNWSDPAITADNNGHALPSIPIIPVVHSEGSGSTAQFTTFMNTDYPSIWQPFLGAKSFTEYFPCRSGSGFICQNGSDGVMNFVSSAAANGAIGYDEYSYPLAKRFPVAKVLNTAGYFVLPDQYNVAVALQHAVINMDKNSPNYLLQTLTNVYVAPEVQAYPLSSYSYILVPTSPTDPRMNTARRQTLADYLYFAVCQGQKEMGPIGYSPLPINLVQASFAQTALLKTADSGVDLTQRDVTTCNNPTFVANQPNVNHLAQIAPVPPSCDKQGQGPCNADGSAPAAAATSKAATGGSGGGTAANHGAGTSGGTGAAGPSSGAAGAAPSGETSVDPDTGQTVSVGDGDGSDGFGDAAAAATDVPKYRESALTSVLAPLAVFELLAVLVVPPVAYFFVLQRRRKRP